MQDTQTEHAEAEPVRETHTTTCCIVGAGPGGAMLAILLARQGVPVVLLEAHLDFDREFRGDTLHPAILEILDEIGLAKRLHQLPHVKLYGPTFATATGPFTPFDFHRLRTRFPYIMFMHQPIFLEFLTEESKKFPEFRLVMGANVQRLCESDGVVQGVRYRATDGWHEVRAVLTVGADGRFSRTRHLAGFEPVATSRPVELVWFRLPRLPGDPPNLAGAFPRQSQGRLMAVVGRADHYQLAYFIPLGQYPALRAAGLDAFRRSVGELEPGLARNAAHLTDWHELSLLSVASSRCRRWYKPGLLLIGDAAHTMTPAAGAGIKYAIEDAVVAANLLAKPLKEGHVELSDLAKVQRQREWPTRFIQALGAFAVKHVINPALRPGKDLRFPRVVRLMFRIPLVRDLAARLVAFGFWRVHVKT